MFNVAEGVAVAKNDKSWKKAPPGGTGALYFIGSIGALVYYIHFHSGTFWLVVLAFLKAAVWPAFLVYHLMQYLKM